jgi:hypothetical protein
MGRPLLALSPAVPNLSLEDPLPTPIYGSAYGTVNAMVIDCGNGDDPCPMAKARICLIEVRGLGVTHLWQELWLVCDWAPASGAMFAEASDIGASLH